MRPFLPTTSSLIIAVICCGNISPSAVQSAPPRRTPRSVAHVAVSVDLTYCRSPNHKKTPLFKIAAQCGFSKLSRFIESPKRYRVGHSPPALHNQPKRICLAAALDVALRALPQFESPHSPAKIAQSQPTNSTDNLRYWFNRETAVIATVKPNDAQWPKPALTHQQDNTLEHQNNSWIFFVTSPDLSDHWYWLLVPRVTADGNVLVRLISER